ncbi:hypothetical protein BH24ACT2_BH24ACT2_04510 [soil metagenome]
MALTRPVDSDALRRAGEWVRPVTLAGEQLLAVTAPLAPLFPEGGLRRGSTVTVEGGPGATSLALALGAAASTGGSWVAGVNLPSLGLLAAAELGVSLERVVMVGGVDPGTWPAVVAALLDAVDVVWAGLPRRVSPGDARRLAARARERGSVLVPVLAWSAAPDGGTPPRAGDWPVAADVRLRPVPSSGWVGPGAGGAGHLAARRVEVVAGGRGAAAQERRVNLWLPAPDGGVAPADAGLTLPSPDRDLSPLRSLSPFEPLGSEKRQRTGRGSGGTGKRGAEM